MYFCILSTLREHFVEAAKRRPVIVYYDKITFQKSCLAVFHAIISQAFGDHPVVLSVATDYQIGIPELRANLQTEPVAPTSGKRI
jgi:hypothetical protein